MPKLDTNDCTCYKLHCLFDCLCVLRYQCYFLNIAGCTLSHGHCPVGFNVIQFVRFSYFPKQQFHHAQSRSGGVIVHIRACKQKRRLSHLNSLQTQNIPVHIPGANIHSRHTSDLLVIFQMNTHRAHGDTCFVLISVRSTPTLVRKASSSSNQFWLILNLFVGIRVVCFSLEVLQTKFFHQLYVLYVLCLFAIQL